jgi:hypothetical protein
MTYTSDIPVSGDSLGGTRDRIRANFQEIASVIGLNHVAFNSTGEGKHKFLQMPEQASAPATAVDEAGFYCKVGTTPAQANLFFRAEDSAGTGGKEYQLTRAIEAYAASFGTNTTALSGANGFGGWTFLPGNLLLQYGNFNPNTSATVVFPVPFNAAPFIVQLTGEASNSSNYRAVISTGTVTATQFVFSGTIDSHFKPLYFMAIGV